MEPTRSVAACPRPPRRCGRCRASSDEVPFRRDKRVKSDGLGAYCKPCEREYNRAYYAANRERLNVENNARYHENRDRYLTAQRTYRLAHIERIRTYDRDRSRGNPVKIERARRWRLANPDRYRANKHGWYLANRQKVSEASRAWRAQHPERYRLMRCEAEARRRVRKRGAAGAIERIDRRTVWERDGRICGLCARPVRFQVMELDHIKPLARGGEHTASNVQPTHRRCNRRKGCKEVPRWAFAISYSEAPAHD